MEARFLAAQAERLADNKRRHQKHRQNKHSNDKVGSSHFEDDAPTLCDEDENSKLFNTTSISNNDDDDDHRNSRKEEGHRFWVNFRKLCSELQSEISSLLLASDQEGGDGDISKDDAAKAYYSTAARRSEGRIKLDCVLNNVRLLRRHCLSPSSVVKNENDTNANQLLLQSILSTPMPDMTQTDTRIISEEIDRLLKFIDEARAIISPKEKFVFKRYRKAMEEKRLLEGNNIVALSGSEPSRIGGDDTHKQTTAVEEEQAEETFSHDGGLLENKSDCVIEIFPDGNIQVDEASPSQIQHYSRPRRVNALHPPVFKNENGHDKTSLSSDSTSFLLQNLTNVTILLHGSRPTLHIKNIHYCHIYVTQATLGPVHLTNCHSSEIRCSCYQLRIHDSINVKFGVWVRSGPIIENCKEMVFEGNYYSGGENSGVGKNMYWDVKDFNWLRTLRKSPNFVVVTDGGEGGDVKEDGHASAEEGAVASIPQQLPAQEDEEEEDSEDEL